MKSRRGAVAGTGRITTVSIYPLAHCCGQLRRSWFIEIGEIPPYFYMLCHRCRNGTGYSYGCVSSEEVTRIANVPGCPSVTSIVGAYFPEGITALRPPGRCR